ncbi:MAG: hypothetical protein LIO93_10180, partial [Bacteroidales bacterium]|nr:hypothetical protein [Bacteroidales bacterium]
DILKRRKTRLQVKSDALTDILEENFNYLQNNAVSLISDSVVDSFISKLPPFVQTLLGKGEKDTMCGCSSSSKFSGFASGALDILPLFMKGGKGIVVAFLIKKLRKFFFK